LGGTGFAGTIFATRRPRSVTRTSSANACLTHRPVAWWSSRIEIVFMILIVSHSNSPGQAGTTDTSVAAIPNEHSEGRKKDAFPLRARLKLVHCILRENYPLNNRPASRFVRYENGSRDVSEKVIPFPCPKSARLDQHGSKLALQLGCKPYALSIFIPEATHRDSKVICIETKRQCEDKPESRSAASASVRRCTWCLLSPVLMLVPPAPVCALLLRFQPPVLAIAVLAALFHQPVVIRALLAFIPFVPVAAFLIEKSVMLFRKTHHWRTKWNGE